MKRPDISQLVLFSAPEKSEIATRQLKKDYVNNWRAKNREKVRAQNKASRDRNRESVRRSSREWRSRNLEIARAVDRERYAAAPEKKIARNAKRRAAEIEATPNWANQFFMSEAYDLAKRREFATKIKWHVDHIVPLKSALVCGLHVENNLQVIPGSENLRKSNRWWPDMPIHPSQSRTRFANPLSMRVFGASSGHHEIP